MIALIAKIVKLAKSVTTVITMPTLIIGVITKMTNIELTKIYNRANNLDPSKHNPITTKRIVTAMREMYKLGIEQTPKGEANGAHT